MADFFRSLQGGFNTGLQLGQVLRQRQLQDALAQEAAQYTPTEGAYGQGLQSNIEQVQGLKQQAIEGGMTPELAAQQYDPSIAELTRRSGLTSADYSVPTDTSGKNYATRQEALQAAAPMRSEGLANVYRQAGEIDKAEELMSRAQQQRLVGLQIGEAERTKAERDAATAREKASADAWKARLAVKDEEGNVTGMRPPTNEDMLWAAQQSAQSLYGAGKTTEAMQAYSNYMTTAKGQIELQGAQRAEALRGIVSRVANGDLDAAKDFYHKFVPDGTNVRSFSEDKDGKIIVKREDLNGNALPDAVLTRDQLLQQLVAFENPSKLIEYTQQSFMNGLHERQFEEQKRHNRATEGLGAERLAIEKKGPLALTLTALKNAGIEYTDEDVRSLAGLNKDDNALLKAQVDAVVKGVSPDNPKSVGAAQEQIRGLFTQAAAAKQQRMAQDAARKAHKDGKIDDFVQELRGKNVTDAVIAAQIRAAGVPVPPSLTPAAPAPQETYTPLSQRLQGLFPGGGTYTPSSTFGLSR